MEFGKVTLILRGYNYKQIKNICEVLLSGKYIKNLEITLNSDNPYTVIEKISKEYSDELNIGAGTVITFDQLRKAHKSGAKFALSPIKMSTDMLDYCKDNNIISIPGAYSPSEIKEMHDLGANIIKVFPSNELSLSYAKKVKEPLGDEINLMAVGGINKDNVGEAFRGGYDYVGSAGGIFAKKNILDQNIEKLTYDLQQFEKQLDIYYQNMEENKWKY